MQKGKYFLNTISVPGLIAGQMTMYAEETTLRNMRNYIPFRAMHVTNISATNNIEIMFDYSPDRKMICLSNGIKNIADQPFSSFSVRNIGATATIDTDIVVELETY
jgi:hypothetical protein